LHGFSFLGQCNSSKKEGSTHFKKKSHAAKEKRCFGKIYGYCYCYGISHGCGNGTGTSDDSSVENSDSDSDRTCTLQNLHAACVVHEHAMEGVSVRLYRL
jgi:hypothetical protein